MVHYTRCHYRAARAHVTITVALIGMRTRIKSRVLYAGARTRDQASQVRTFQLETVEMCKARESWWIGGKDGALLWVDLSLAGIGMLTCLELWQVGYEGL
jgi:hypothetical protein